MCVVSINFKIDHIIIDYNNDPVTILLTCMLKNGNIDNTIFQEMQVVNPLSPQ